MPEKHLKCIAGGLPIQSLLRTLKTLTRHALVAYNDAVGCGYTIQYPYGEGVTTDYAPCFSAPDILFGCQ
ncbi:hypothetical protein [Bartonella sp. CB74]|uniref:hypothetical protein n=1 Tax=Bartonella sp. CB74 TaxID=3113620 RepID=UPI002F96C6E9